MSRNAPNSTTEDAEQVKKITPRNLVLEFVTPYVETRLVETNGGAFYSQAKLSK